MSEILIYTAFAMTCLWGVARHDVYADLVDLVEHGVEGRCLAAFGPPSNEHLAAGRVDHLLDVGEVVRGEADLRYRDPLRASSKDSKDELFT